MLDDERYGPEVGLPPWVSERILLYDGNLWVDAEPFSFDFDLTAPPQSMRVKVEPPIKVLIAE